MGGGATTYAVNADGSAGLPTGIALEASGPIEEGYGISGWFAFARVVDPATASPSWRLTVHAICTNAS